MGQGIWSLLVAVVGAVVLGIGVLVAMACSQRPWAASRARRAALYVLLGLATAATLRFHSRMAQARAARVTQACEAYHATHGSYPARLADLVPEFLAAVPRAKYTMAWGEFSYWASSPESHTLLYVAVPPFGRRSYNFESRRWGKLD